MNKGNWIWIAMGVLFLGGAIIDVFNLTVRIGQGILLFLLAVACIIYFYFKYKKS